MKEINILELPLKIEIGETFPHFYQECYLTINVQLIVSFYEESYNYVMDINCLSSGANEKENEIVQIHLNPPNQRTNNNEEVYCC